MAEMEKEVMTLDDEETFGNFYKTVSPSTLQDSSMTLTEEDLSQIEANTPKSVHKYNNNRSTLKFYLICTDKNVVYEIICHQ